MTAAAHPADGDWFGQPRGLTILVLTQTWEVFSFFGMRAMLVLYLIDGLHLGQAKASLVYGLYSAFVYFTPIFGGFISDRWLGHRAGVLLGGSIIATGHFMMAAPSLLYPALVAIAVGVGFFVPNLPSQIPGLYVPGDPRRGTSFNVYYAGINLGAFVAPLVCGTLGERLGWDYGFGAAGVGMIVGLAIYSFGSRFLTPVATGGLSDSSVLGSPPSDRTASVGLAIVWLAVVVFRGAYEQIGNTVAVWASADVDRMAGSFTVPASWFQSINPLGILVLTPIVVWLWSSPTRRGRPPSAVGRMARGAALLAFAFALLAAVAGHAASVGDKPGWGWLAAFVMLLTVGELYILPVGFGLFAARAPAALGATTIAIWYLASFGGNLLAGLLGRWWGSVSHATFFMAMGIVALVACAMLTGVRYRYSNLEE